MPVILTFLKDYTLGVQGTPNQTDSDMNFSRWCDQGKITKKDLKDNYEQWRF